MEVSEVSDVPRCTFPASGMRVLLLTVPVGLAPELNGSSSALGGIVVKVALGRKLLSVSAETQPFDGWSSFEL